MSLADGLRGEDQRLLGVLTVAVGFAIGNVTIGDVAISLLLLQSILLLLMLLLLQLEYRHCLLQCCCRLTGGVRSMEMFALGKGWELRERNSRKERLGMFGKGLS